MIIEKYGDVSKKSRSKRLKATCPDCGCRAILDEEDYEIVEDLMCWDAFDSHEIVYANIIKWRCPCCDKDVKSKIPKGGPFVRLLDWFGIAEWYSQCNMVFKSVIPICFIIAILIGFGISGCCKRFDNIKSEWSEKCDYYVLTDDAIIDEEFFIPHYTNDIRYSDGFLYFKDERTGNQYKLEAKEYTIFDCETGEMIEYVEFK